MTSNLVLDASHKFHARLRLYSTRALLPCSRAFARAVAEKSMASSRNEDTVAFLTLKNELMTLLRKTLSFLPTALSEPSQQVRYCDSLDLWSDTLSSCYNNLNATEQRPVCIGVVGVGEWSGSQDLITSLLEEPLSSDAGHSDVLRGRWKDRDISSQLTISSYGSNPQKDSALILASSYLSHFSFPVEITEVSSYSAVMEKKDLKILHNAEIPIVVVNPLTTSLAAWLQSTRLPKNSIIILNSTTSGLSDHALQSIIKVLPAGMNGMQFLLADPPRALDALNFLSSDAASSASVQRYQDGFTGSRVSRVTEAIHNLLHKRAFPSGVDCHGPLTAFRMSSVVWRLCDALNVSHDSVRRAKDELNETCATLSRLSAKVEEVQERTRVDTFRSSTGKGGRLNAISEALIKSEKDMKLVMDRLTWWRMVPRVDEISSVLGTALDRNWFPDLEKQLILQTGRLSLIQSDFTKASISLLSVHSTPLFNSALLKNKILQLQTSSLYQLTPTSLTQPLHARRKQIELPTTMLHLEAQRVVLSMCGGVMAGAGVTWAGWYEWLAASGHGVFGFAGLDANYSAGIGVLGALVCVRWAIGRWEKAKKRWWQDWKRVAEGLERDLQITLAAVIKDKVTIVPITTCTEVSQMAQNRREKLEEVQEKLINLQVALDDLVKRTSLPL